LADATNLTLLHPVFEFYIDSAGIITAKPHQLQQHLETTKTHPQKGIMSGPAKLNSGSGEKGLLDLAGKGPK